MGSLRLWERTSMTDLQKYIIATVLLFFWIGGIAFLSQLIPMWIDRALPI